MCLTYNLRDNLIFIDAPLQKFDDPEKFRSTRRYSDHINLLAMKKVSIIQKDSLQISPFYMRNSGQFLFDKNGSYYSLYHKIVRQPVTYLLDHNVYCNNVVKSFSGIDLGIHSDLLSVSDIFSGDYFSSPEWSDNNYHPKQVLDIINNRSSNVNGVLLLVSIPLTDVQVIKENEHKIISSRVNILGLDQIKKLEFQKLSNSTSELHKSLYNFVVNPKDIWMNIIEYYKETYKLVDEIYRSGNLFK